MFDASIKDNNHPVPVVIRDIYEKMFLLTHEYPCINFAMDQSETEEFNNFVFIIYAKGIEAESTLNNRFVVISNTKQKDSIKFGFTEDNGNDELRPIKMFRYSINVINGEQLAKEVAKYLVEGIYPEDNEHVINVEDEGKKPTQLKEVNVVKVAKIIYEANRAYCEGTGDYSFKPWNEAEDWQIDANVKGVRFHYDNPTAGPDASHNEWMNNKFRDGWQWGPVKDPEKKLHPCLCPFDMLPPEQQYKDKMFKNIVEAMREYLTEEVEKQ